jgi:hypothetical protein
MAEPKELEDNEDIYDEQISPLMERIIAICKKHRIPMIMSFEYAPEEFVTTRLPFEGETGKFAEALEVIRPSHHTSTAIITVTDGKGEVKKEVITVVS